MALVVAFCTKILSRYKFHTFHHLIEQEKQNNLPFGTAFGFLFVINLLLGLIAWLMVFCEPLAAGSGTQHPQLIAIVQLTSTVCAGIPEVKCFLNGLDIPRLVKFRTLLCKAVGIIFAVCSGLPLGKEGPMVHMGAVVAAMVSQVESLFAVYPLHHTL